MTHQLGVTHHMGAPLGAPRHRAHVGALARRVALGLSAVLSIAALAACAQPQQRAVAPTVAAPVTASAQMPTRPDDGVAVAALLAPLSGQFGNVGADMVNAAQMAVQQLAGDNFTLVVKDTAGTPEGAAAAARAAIAEGADIILGPLFAQSVAAVGPVARSAGVNVVAFSSDSRVAGGNVFIMGFAPEQQVARIVAYAVSRGDRVIAALAPRTEYGNLALEALRAAAPREGAALGPVVTYDPTAPDHAATVQSLASGGFDALFVPDGGNSLLRVMPYVAYNDIDRRSSILGTGLWDNEEILSEPAVFNGMFASVSPVLVDAFNAEYALNFGAEPSRRASLAYDATALAANLARRGPTIDYSAEALRAPTGFQGRDGIFRFNASGVAERGLAVLRATPTGFQEVDPAPSSFVGFDPARGPA